MRLVSPSAFLGLFGQQNGLDIGQHAALSDGHPREQTIQLLVIPDGQLEMSGHDPALLVVSGRISGQLEDLRGQILHDGGQIDGGSGAHALGVVAFAE